MSVTISRLYNWVTDKGNSVPITASRVDAEMDQVIVALNRKVLCATSAPSSPIAGQTWFDTTNKLLKQYRNNEWVSMGPLHVGTSAPATPQEGDLWWDSTNNKLYVYDGASQVLIQQGIPTNFREGLICRQSGTTTLTVGIGKIEVNGGYIAKTTVTTMTISTAGDWAGGSSLRAVSTMAFVGIDSAGNIKLHTTAPTHADYAVSVATSKKRYATWSGTVYRIIGWFYMNATGSGELSTYEVGNLKDPGVDNKVVRVGLTDDTVNDTSYGTDLTECTVHFYTSGGLVNIRLGAIIATVGGGTDNFKFILDDGSNIANSERAGFGTTAGQYSSVLCDYAAVYAQGTKTFNAQAKIASNSMTVENKTVIIEEAEA